LKLIPSLGREFITFGLKQEDGKEYVFGFDVYYVRDRKKNHRGLEGKGLVYYPYKGLKRCNRNWFL